MATFADKLREESYVALQEAVAHNKKVDCAVLELIYDKCEDEAKKGKFNYSIAISQIKGAIKADYYNKRFREVELKYIKDVAEEKKEREVKEREGIDFFPDDLSFDMPEILVEYIKKEAEDFWYHRVDCNKFDIICHLSGLMVAEGFEVDFSIANLPVDKCMTLYWSNNMGGNN